MADVTFRDFAAAVMGNDTERAASVLTQLLGLAAGVATDATTHFRAQMTSAGPAFMGKAMGLRTAVTTGTDAEIGGLLVECFGLPAAAVSGAVATLRQTYPAGA
ncbi:MAG: hypothetical protein IPQ07_42900 [Myxococcales bacterium]|nr:hypothetical protein [Myxococcales bacterium]